MPADDHPILALKRQFELEDASASPVPGLVLQLLSSMPLTWPFDSVVARLKDQLSADSGSRIKAMLGTCMDELLRLDSEVSKIKDALSAEEAQRRAEVAKELLLDAARKASNTRDLERVRHIGLILANGTTERTAADGDEIEEMMRVAMDVNDRDLAHLRELARIEGPIIERTGRIERFSAYTTWERCSWGTRTESELDSVFSKLAGYGLVAQIPPPNNLNIGADFQNRYVLLKKGLRFINLIQSRSAPVKQASQNSSGAAG